MLRFSVDFQKLQKRGVLHFFEKTLKKGGGLHFFEKTFFKRGFLIFLRLQNFKNINICNDDFSLQKSHFKYTIL